MIVGHPATVGWLLWRYASRHPAWAAGLVWLVTDRVGWAAIAQAADGPGMSPVSGGPIPGNQGVNLLGREPIPWRGPGTDSSRVRSCRPWRPRRVLGPSANQSSMSCCGHSARAVPRDLRNAGAVPVPSSSRVFACAGCSACGMACVAAMCTCQAHAVTQTRLLTCSRPNSGSRNAPNSAAWSTTADPARALAAATDELHEVLARLGHPRTVAVWQRRRLGRPCPPAGAGG